MQESEKLLTLKDVMERLRVSRSTVLRLIQRGDLPVHKVGNGLRFYEKDLKMAVKMVRDARHQVEPIDTKGN